MHYIDIKDAIAASGLRLVLVQGFPSPWGQAAKAMMEYKRLEYIVAPQRAGGDNPELLAWSGVNSGPVVAWNDEKPLNRWNDILILLERLAPERPLVPESAAERVQFFGIAHEICGELGLGWNRRLDMFSPPPMESADPPARASGMLGKYGYNPSDAALANPRTIAMLRFLSETLASQRAAGSEYLVGNQVSAVDFYWAAFSNLVILQPPEECPLAPGIRPIFEKTPADVVAAVDSSLLEHRDRIMHAHFTIPMQM